MSEHNPISGPISSIHQWVDMTDRVARQGRGDGRAARTCKPALGYSFAAGTTDGPGEFDFKQVKFNVVIQYTTSYMYVGENTLLELI